MNRRRTQQLATLLTPGLLLGLCLGLADSDGPAGRSAITDLKPGEILEDRDDGKIQGPRSMPATAIEYARMCEAELGVPPRIVLDEAIEIPLYVDGVQKYGNLGRKCDNPSFLGKASVSGSMLQRHPGRTTDGKPLPDVFWISFARNSSFQADKVIGSVQMIGYNRKTGATAFFESCDQIGPWVTLEPKTWKMQGTMPWIDDPAEFNRAFVTPSSRNIQCVECHQNDPFITNDFINAAKIPGTEESVVPALGAEAPYYVIGGENWDMRTIDIEGHACFECHRVGMNTMLMFMENGWDPNDHMPPHDPGSLSEDLESLLAAWRQGPEDVPGAQWIVPPARGLDRQVVGADYPYRAPFNRPDRGRKLAGRTDGKEKEWDEGKWSGGKLQGDGKIAPEVRQLLDRLKDPATRQGFEYWIREHGMDLETLQKLRAMVGDDG